MTPAIDIGQFGNDEESANALLDGCAALQANGAFKNIVSVIRERYAMVQRLNDVRGKENLFTEAQAWSWFLGAVNRAEAERPAHVIDTGKQM